MPALESDATLHSLTERDFQLFRNLIHKNTGIWLRDGKQVMLASRLSRRLRHYGLASFSEYYQLIQTSAHSGEISELINAVTTNKTSFFREPHHFEFLRKTVVPEVLQSSRNSSRAISVWSAACSTGEEPYSIAITLLEALRNLRPEAAAAEGVLEVIATDIDTKVLATARGGIYELAALQSIAPDLQKRYFLRGKDGMRGSIKVKEEVCNLVEFSRLNLMDASWPVKGPFDAIFFRNALIYFQQETQDTFLRRMARLLRPRGYLFLGHSEHIPWLHNLLEPLNKTTYRLRGRP
jgi:chemotaxis protein methyltransferase CheR